MALLATLTPLPVASTGDMEWTVALISTLTGLQEPESGWLLCNGASITNSGRYAALYTLLAGNYGGAGLLPVIIDGVQPVGKGAGYTTIGTNDGAQTVTLGLENVWNHTHTWPFYDIYQGLTNGPVNCGSTPPYDDGGYHVGYTSNTSAVGSGGAHNNMPPYLVVEGMLIKL